MSSVGHVGLGHYGSHVPTHQWSLPSLASLAPQFKQATAAKHHKAQFAPPCMYQVCIPLPEGVQKSVAEAIGQILFLTFPTVHLLFFLKRKD